jgi:hypothetical protein
MNKIASFGMYPSNFAFRVFSVNVGEYDTYPDVTDQTLAQGFSARLGSLSFYTLAECRWITIEIWVAEPSDEICLLPETVRAILVPFSVFEAGTKIADIIGLVEGQVHLTRGEYALVFELKLQDDVEYLNSAQYQENVADCSTQEWCRLTFYPRENSVQPEILRLDAWSEPTYPIDGYAGLNPTYPLLMEI